MHLAESFCRWPHNIDTTRSPVRTVRVGGHVTLGPGSHGREGEEKGEKRGGNDAVRTASEPLAPGDDGPGILSHRAAQ